MGTGKMLETKTFFGRSLSFSSLFYQGMENGFIDKYLKGLVRKPPGVHEKVKTDTANMFHEVNKSV